MPRAILVAELIDGLREDLDFSRGRIKRLPGRVGPEILQNHMGLLGCGNLQVALGPKILEFRKLDEPLARPLAGIVVQMAEPFHLAPPLGEGLPDAKMPGEIGQNIVITLCLAHGLDHLLHRDDEAVQRGGADVVALETCCRR